jgi:hypothetical protein
MPFFPSVIITIITVFIITTNINNNALVIIVPFVSLSCHPLLSICVMLILTLLFPSYLTYIFLLSLLLALDR